MKHVQQVRGKWVVRVTVPEDLRPIIGKRELVETDLPANPKDRHRRAVAVINAFYAQIDEARDTLASRRPTISSAAKHHFRSELEADDKERAAQLNGASPDFITWSRAIYAARLRLLVAGEIGRDEAEALISYAANDLTAKGLAPDIPRLDLLRMLAEVQLEALARFEDRDSGNVAEGMGLTSNRLYHLSHCSIWIG